jgi:hypothetical protein
MTGVLGLYSYPSFLEIDLRDVDVTLEKGVPSTVSAGPVNDNGSLREAEVSGSADDCQGCGRLLAEETLYMRQRNVDERKVSKFISTVLLQAPRPVGDFKGATSQYACLRIDQVDLLNTNLLSK